MHWLIDGYNVLGHELDLRGGETAGLEAARASLLRLVARVAGRLEGDDFTVVFDGARIRDAGAAPVRGRVRVVFSRPPDRADDVLARLARETGRGGVVVTSDRRVQDAARRAGCTPLGSADFLDASEGAPLPDSPDGEDDEDEGNGRPPRKGPARRESREARERRRVLRRLRHGR